jgi:hypothetical protein
MKVKHDIVLNDNQYELTLRNNEKFTKMFISQDFIDDEQPEMLYRMFMKMVEELNAPA